MKDLVFDVHQHLGEAAVMGEASAEFVPSTDYEERVAIMDRFGITQAALSPTSQYERPRGLADTVAMNDRVADYRDTYRDRFPVAFGTVDPLQGVENGIKEIERIATTLSLQGIIWHHRMQGTWIADSRMYGFLEAVEEHGLVALIHVISESTLEAPWGLEMLATRFPKVTFVALDPFTSPTQFQVMMMMAERVDNVYFDTAGIWLLGRFLEKWITTRGSERLIFGSDLITSPLSLNVPYVKNEIEDSSDLTDADKDNILWRNAERIFRLT
jgi:predicted TIM-barrel fold metal-dependent hydrolase